MRGGLNESSVFIAWLTVYTYKRLCSDEWLWEEFVCCTVHGLAEMIDGLMHLRARIMVWPVSCWVHYENTWSGEGDYRIEKMKLTVE